MISDRVRLAIWEAATQHKIDPKFLTAIILVESGGQPYKTRFEPGWKYFSDVEKWAQTLGTTVQTEHVLQQFSWGLAQLMGSVMRELGFTGDLPEACDIKINTYYAAKKLKILFSKYTDIKDVAAAYNAGVPVKDQSGKFRNQAYVNKVMQKLKELS